MLEPTRAHPLEQALATFADHKAELLASGHNGRWVLIHEDEVMGIYETRRHGLADGYCRFGNAPFLVREIAERPRAVNLGTWQSGCRGTIGAITRRDPVRQTRWRD